MKIVRRRSRYNAESLSIHYPLPTTPIHCLRWPGGGSRWQLCPEKQDFSAVRTPRSDSASNSGQRELFSGSREERGNGVYEFCNHANGFRHPGSGDGTYRKVCRAAGYWPGAGKFRTRAATGSCFEWAGKSCSHTDSRASKLIVGVPGGNVVGNNVGNPGGKPSEDNYQRKLYWHDRDIGFG